MANSMQDRSLTMIEYWDLASWGKNIVWETSPTSEVHTGKWKRAGQKELKMTYIHLFGHHNWTWITFEETMGLTLF